MDCKALIDMDIGSAWKGRHRLSLRRTWANEHSTFIAHSDRVCVQVLDTYHFGHVRLINVAVTSDCSRLIAIGPSVPLANGPQPARQTKVEKRIIGRSAFGRRLYFTLTEVNSIQHANETKGEVRLNAAFGKAAMLIPF